MSPTSEALADVRNYMARDKAIIGPFEVVFDAMFGPFQHDQHVKCRASHIEAGTLATRLRAADDAVRAECARQTAEFRARIARNNRPALIAAE